VRCWFCSRSRCRLGCWLWCRLGGSRRRRSRDRCKLLFGGQLVLLLACTRYHIGNGTLRGERNEGGSNLLVNTTVIVVSCACGSSAPIPIAISDPRELTLLPLVPSAVLVPTGANCTRPRFDVDVPLSVSPPPIGTPMSVLTGVREMLGVGIPPVEGEKWTSEGSAVGEDEDTGESGSNRTF